MKQEGKRRMLHLMGKKHSLEVMMLLGKETKFTDLLREIHVSSKVLSERLKELREHGLITRQVIDGKKLGTLYKRTPLGDTLQKIVEEIEVTEMKKTGKK